MVLKSGSLCRLFLLSAPHPALFLGSMYDFLASLVIFFFIACQVCMKTCRDSEWCHHLQRGFSFFPGGHTAFYLDQGEAGLSQRSWLNVWGVYPDLCSFLLSVPTLFRWEFPSTMSLPKSLLCFLSCQLLSLWFLELFVIID